MEGKLAHELPPQCISAYHALECLQVDLDGQRDGLLAWLCLTLMVLFSSWIPCLCHFGSSQGDSEGQGLLQCTSNLYLYLFCQQPLTTGYSK